MITIIERAKRKESRRISLDLYLIALDTYNEMREERDFQYSMNNLYKYDLLTKKCDSFKKGTLASLKIPIVKYLFEELEDLVWIIF